MDTQTPITSGMSPTLAGSTTRSTSSTSLGSMSALLGGSVASDLGGIAAAPISGVNGTAIGLDPIEGILSGSVGYHPPLQSPLPGMVLDESQQALPFALTQPSAGMADMSFTPGFMGNTQFPVMAPSPPSYTTSTGPQLFVPAPAMGRRVLRRQTRSLSHPYIPHRYPQGQMTGRHGPAATNGLLPAAYPATTRPARSSTCIIPAVNQDGTSKCCANCDTVDTPSWRRHPDTQELLCNACGLYLRLHRKPRPVTYDDSGHLQVIRKNAAVRREPINLPRENDLRQGFYQHEVTPLGYQSPVRSTTSLSGLQAVGAMYPGISGVPPVSRYQTPAIIDEMMHMHIFGSQEPGFSAGTSDSGASGALDMSFQPSSTGTSSSSSDPDMKLEPKPEPKSAPNGTF
ncbi:hypothetical protein GGF46_003208 [Coemansia sp. RSA 552]|nr:hypothetical protein GGF46_003208 [Coemansia sp. RSA 552]